MNTHTITATVEVQFRLNDMPHDEHETAYPEIEIEYSVTPGCPARGPSYSSGGEPATSAEIELLSAKLINGDGLSADQAKINEWAQDWLDNEGYDRAVENAESDNEPDPDTAYDRARDERITR